MFSFSSIFTIGAVIDRERHHALERPRPGDEHFNAARRQVGRDPRLVRAGGLLSACDHGRLDTLAAMAGGCL